MPPKARKPRRFAPQLVLSDTAKPAIFAAMDNADLWPLYDMLMAETCPREARTFAARLLVGEITLPNHRPITGKTHYLVMAVYVKQLREDGQSYEEAVAAAAEAFACSESTVRTAISWWRKLTAK
jgi:hypothetical protein